MLLIGLEAGQREIIAPTIHSNGTSRDALLDAYCVAGGALTQALEALADAGPNGRDYYPQGSDAIRRATAEHEARLKKLREVRDELRALAEHVSG